MLLNNTTVQTNTVLLAYTQFNLLADIYFVIINSGAIEVDMVLDTSEDAVHASVTEQVRRIPPGSQAEILITDNFAQYYSLSAYASDLTTPCAISWGYRWSYKLGFNATGLALPNDYKKF